MDIPDNLMGVLSADRSVTIVEKDIYSVFSDRRTQHHYDKRATVYDALVNTRLYCRVAWGSLPDDYISFARDAIVSGSGVSSSAGFLDAGCGSLVFTAPSYLQSSQKVIAFDESLAMLHRARERLLKLAGAVPKHIVLLQADITDLPFQPNSFQGVLCMNVLHHIEDAGALIGNLKALLGDEGHLDLTSLVYNDRFPGDVYLDGLHAFGEFARPRSGLELQGLLNRVLGDKVVYRVKGNMAFASNHRQTSTEF